MLVPFVFGCLADLAHDIEESLAEGSVELNNCELAAFLVDLRGARLTLSLIFLYWISSDSMLMSAMSMVLICSLLPTAFRRCLSFLASRPSVPAQLCSSSRNACCETSSVSFITFKFIVIASL